VASLAETLPQRRPVIDVRIADLPPEPADSDRLYLWLVRGGLAVTLGAGVALAMRLRRYARRERTAEAAIPS
jgi:hypothetical protein